MTFDENISKLVNLEKKIELITGNHINFIFTYYVKNFNMFTLPFHTHKKNEKLYNYELKPGKLSTCFALLSLLNSDISTDGIIKKFYIEGRKNVFEHFYNLLLSDSNSWEHSSMEPYDIYNTPFKLIFIRKYEDLLDIEFHKQYSDDINELDQNQHILYKPFLNKDKFLIEAISKIIKNFLINKEAVKFSDEFDFSAFLSYWNIESLFYWLEMLLENDNPKVPRNRYIKESLINFEILEDLLYNIFIWAKNQLYRQRAFYNDKDNMRMDPVRSIYCLLIYKKYHEFYQKYYQNQKTTKYRIGKYDSSQVQKFSSLISKHLVDDGLWKKYLPVAMRTFTESHIYPFPLTTIERFLNNIDISGNNLGDYIVLIEQVLTWVDKNERRNYGEMVKLNDNQIVYRGSYTGWKTPHAVNPYGHPECWSTSLVFDALWSISKTIKKIITKEIINQFDGNYNDKFLPNSFIERWDSIINLKENENISLKKFICYNILLPRLKYKKSEEWKDFPNSFLLYGPPGTGKSSLVKSIAFSIGWSFVRIDTSIFLSSGLDKAGPKVMEVFKQLKHLDKTVILFDEIDEIIKSRDDKSASMENKLLTNTVLTLLNDLAENKKIMIFIATNYSNRIDSAITRPGRIDFRILVNYPNIEEFIKNFKYALNKYIKENKNNDIKLNNSLKDFRNFTTEMDVQNKINDMCQSLEDKLKEIIHCRSIDKEDPSDTDITFLRSKLFFKNLLEKMEESNDFLTQLPDTVKDYFGVIKLDKENQISEPNISGSLYPLNKIPYTPDFDKKLRNMLEKYYPRDNLECLITFKKNYKR